MMRVILMCVNWKKKHLKRNQMYSKSLELGLREHKTHAQNQMSFHFNSFFKWILLFKQDACLSTLEDYRKIITAFKILGWRKKKTACMREHTSKSMFDTKDKTNRTRFSVVWWFLRCHFILPRVKNVLAMAIPQNERLQQPLLSTLWLVILIKRLSHTAYDTFATN